MPSPRRRWCDTLAVAHQLVIVGAADLADLSIIAVKWFLFLETPFLILVVRSEDDLTAQNVLYLTNTKPRVVESILEREKEKEMNNGNYCGQTSGTVVRDKAQVQ